MKLDSFGRSLALHGACQSSVVSWVANEAPQNAFCLRQNLITRLISSVHRPAPWPGLTRVQQLIHKIWSHRVRKSWSRRLSSETHGINRVRLITNDPSELQSFRIICTPQSLTWPESRNTDANKYILFRPLNEVKAGMFIKSFANILFSDILLACSHVQKKWKEMSEQSCCV